MGLARNYLFIYPPDFIVLIVAGCHSQKEREREREREGGGRRKRKEERGRRHLKHCARRIFNGSRRKEGEGGSPREFRILWITVKWDKKERKRERNSATSTSRDYVMSVTRRFMILIKLHRMIQRLNSRGGGGGTFRILVLLFWTLIFILLIFDTCYFNFFRRIIVLELCYFRAEVFDEFSLLIS